MFRTSCFPRYPSLAPVSGRLLTVLAPYDVNSLQRRLLCDCSASHPRETSNSFPGNCLQYIGISNFKTVRAKVTNYKGNPNSQDSHEQDMARSTRSWPVTIIYSLVMVPFLCLVSWIIFAGHEVFWE